MPQQSDQMSLLRSAAQAPAGATLDVNWSNATVVDTRPPQDQVNIPIGPSAYTLRTVVNTDVVPPATPPAKYRVQVSIMYNGLTGAASWIFIHNAIALY